MENACNFYNGLSLRQHVVDNSIITNGILKYIVPRTVLVMAVVLTVLFLISHEFYVYIFLIIGILEVEVDTWKTDGAVTVFSIQPRNILFVI